VRFGGYLPHDAFKVFMTHTELTCVVRDEHVLHAKSLDIERTMRLID
jgi:hypothetical protein